MFVFVFFVFSLFCVFLFKDSIKDTKIFLKLILNTFNKLRVFNA